MAGKKIVGGFSETYIETAAFGGLTKIQALNCNCNYGPLKLLCLSGVVLGCKLAQLPHSSATVALEWATRRNEHLKTSTRRCI